MNVTLSMNWQRLFPESSVIPEVKLIRSDDSRG